MKISVCGKGGSGKSTIVTLLANEARTRGYKCFEESGEKLYRIWLKMDAAKEDDLY